MGNCGGCLIILKTSSCLLAFQVLNIKRFLVFFTKKLKSNLKGACYRIIINSWSDRYLSKQLLKFVDFCSDVSNKFCNSLWKYFYLFVLMFLALPTFDMCCRISFSWLLGVHHVAVSYKCYWLDLSRIGHFKSSKGTLI